MPHKTLRLRDASDAEFNNSPLSDSGVERLVSSTVGWAADAECLNNAYIAERRKVNIRASVTL
jgi:hypothetical protein